MCHSTRPRGLRGGSREPARARAISSENHRIWSMVWKTPHPWHGACSFWGSSSEFLAPGPATPPLALSCEEPARALRFRARPGLALRDDDPPRHGLREHRARDAREVDRAASRTPGLRGPRLRAPRGARGAGSGRRAPRDPARGRGARAPARAGSRDFSGVRAGEGHLVGAGGEGRADRLDVLARREREHEVGAPAGERPEHGGQRPGRGGGVGAVGDAQRRAAEQLDRAPGARRPRAQRARARRGAARSRRPRAARRPRRGRRCPARARRGAAARPRRRTRRPARRTRWRNGSLSRSATSKSRPSSATGQPSSAARARTTARASSGSAPEHRRYAGLQDARLLGGDRGEAVAEHLGVLELDARHAGRSGRHDVRRVEAPAEPHLEHHRVERRPRRRAAARPRSSRRRRSARAPGPRRAAPRPRAAAARGPRARAAPSTSRPSMRKRSVQRARCGEVKVPTRRPAPRSSASASRAVEPLPFEPAMWIGRSPRSGLPDAREQRADRREGEARPGALFRPLVVDQALEPALGLASRRHGCSPGPRRAPRHCTMYFFQRR